MAKSPLGQVNDNHGGKDKLVDKLVGMLDGRGATKDDLRKRLLSVSNNKLLRLHRAASAERDTFGGRDKLVGQAALGREKDKDYVTRIESFSTARLVNLATTAQRRQKRAAAKAAAKPATKPATKPAKKKPAGKAKAAK